jgi:hypothetical protein
MDNQELRDLLEKVHHEIEQTEEVDEKDRQLLRELDSDIRQLLDKPDTNENIIEQLEYAIEHFEVTHPDLTIQMNKMLEILSGAGL